MELSKEDSLVIKGIAICLMFCWHLFYCPNPVGLEFGSITRAVGVIGDTCVSMFLFVSGYGLAKACSKVEAEHMFYYRTSSLHFVIKRLFKFYTNFWFVFLIFVPIGVFVFDIPIIESNDFSTIIQRIFIEFFLGGSYNPNWWFNGLIVVLYLLFPTVYAAVKYEPFILLFGTLFLVNVEFYFLPVYIGIYLFIFVVGVYMGINRSHLADRFRLFQVSKTKKGLCLFLLMGGGNLFASFSRKSCRQFNLLYRNTSIQHTDNTYCFFRIKQLS